MIDCAGSFLDVENRSIAARRATQSLCTISRTPRTMRTVIAASGKYMRRSAPTSELIGIMLDVGANNKNPVKSWAVPADKKYSNFFNYGSPKGRVNMACFPKVQHHNEKLTGKKMVCPKYQTTPVWNILGA